LAGERRCLALLCHVVVLFVLFVLAVRSSTMVLHCSALLLLIRPQPMLASRMCLHLACWMEHQVPPAALQHISSAATAHRSTPHAAAAATAAVQV
jgi:hypothetical protein